MNICKAIEILKKNNEKAAICTIVETKGSTPRKIGAKMIVKSNGAILGSIGGGNLEKKVIENALFQIKNNEPKLYKHDLLHQHSMCCGGSVSIYIEPLKMTNRLYVFGAGHTGSAIAKMGTDLDFDIYVIDNRKEYIDSLNINGINKLNANYSSLLPSLPFDKNTYVLIMTYEHSFDRDILSFCINKPNAYLGMIGSKRKVEITKKMFLEGKIASQKQLDLVDMPMGIEINAETPEEIAISIWAKIIKIKNAAHAN